MNVGIDFMSFLKPTINPKVPFNNKHETLLKKQSQIFSCGQKCKRRWIPRRLAMPARRRGINGGVIFTFTWSRHVQQVLGTRYPSVVKLVNLCWPMCLVSSDMKSCDSLCGVPASHGERLVSVSLFLTYRIWDFCFPLKIVVLPKSGIGILK